MKIDEKLLENGVTTGLLIQLLQLHESQTEKYARLWDYYMGKHDILKRTKRANGASNARVVANHAKYIVDMCQSYMVGNPVTYTTTDEYDIEPLKEAYWQQDISNLDSELVKHMCVYGRAYELTYADENSTPKSVLLNPVNAFVCYSQTADEHPVLGVYYYRRYNLEGVCTGIVCNVYDSNTVSYYESNQDSLLGLELKSTDNHYFNGVPIVEHRNNVERQGEFEQLMPLIDNYNTVMSDRVNDKEQFVESFLFLKGIELDTEQAKKLKDEKILMSYDDAADAKYLSKIMTEEDVKVLRDDLKEDIHHLSMVPDLSDERFGNNLSGVAIKYKLFGFEQKIKNKERYFTKSLKERFKLYNNYLALKNSMSIVPVHRVDFVFTYNLPANELEISQMVTNLNGIVSQETLLDIVPFVSDAKEEAKLVQEEKAEGYKQYIEHTEDMARGGGY